MVFLAHGSLKKAKTADGPDDKVDRKILNLKYDWQDPIVSDKEVLLGKPTIKGTKISVEHIVGLLAQGWTKNEILENFPRWPTRRKENTDGTTANTMTYQTQN